jgi:hypothetical protein
VADEEIVFPIELIPDRDSVFLRAHKTRMRDGVPTGSAFTPKGNTGLSVDWEKYSTAQASREHGAIPADNAILRMVAGDIRKIREGLDILHVPLPLNRAHSEINLPENRTDQTQVRVLLGRIAIVQIPLAL